MDPAANNDQVPPNGARGGIVSDHEVEGSNPSRLHGGEDNMHVQDMHPPNPPEAASDGQQQQVQIYHHQQQYQQPQVAFAGPPPPHPPIPPLEHNHYPGGPQPPFADPTAGGQHAIAMAYYEARMRDHAAAYASAAAGAAWAAAQIAQQIATGNRAGLPGILPPPPSGLDPNNFGANVPPPPPGGGFFQNPNSAAGNHGNGPMMMGDPNNFFPPQQQGPPNNNNNNIEAPWQQQQNNDIPWINHQQQQLPPHHGNNNNNDFNYDEAYATRNTRRKRTQGRPPGGISFPRRQGQEYRQENNYHNNNNNNTFNQHATLGGGGNNNNNNNSRVRRRLRDHGDSSNSSCATSITSYNSDQAMGGGGNYPFEAGNTSNNHGSGTRTGPHPSRAGGRGGNHYHRYKKRMKQPRDDSSLLGKTGVAALYEWCDKRRIQLSFALLTPLHENGTISIEAGEGFEMAVYLENVERGRGRGPSKGSAKQDSARKALTSLVPGIVFDAGTGFVAELPTNMIPPHAMANASTYNQQPQQQQSQLLGHNPASLEDLAPHLAKRLAIAGNGRDEDIDDRKRASSSRASNSQPLMRGADYSSRTLKRALAFYPGTTSTTNSEEDDENAYYASRKNVFSVLLHAIFQIDDRIPEAPQYVFDVPKVPKANAQMKRKGPASSYGSSAIVIQRGPFTCTATLKVLSTPDASAKNKCAETDKTQSARRVEKATEAGTSDEEKNEECVIDSKAQALADGSPGKKESLSILTAVGVGGTKRESKHTASAKLLALLFPECKTMAEVKAAAEAAREGYAASKAALKQQTNRNNNTSSNRRRREGRSKMPRLSLSSGISQLNVTPTSKDPPLPTVIAEELQAILGVQQSKTASIKARFQKLNLNHDSNFVDPDVDVGTTHTGSDAETRPPNSSVDRPFSRRKQLDAQVDKALTALNEHDELPDELTVDDVGRTVLRRAEQSEPEDIERIHRLLSGHNSTNSNAPASILGLGGELVTDGDGGLRLWGASTIVLLLCRAIAAFEDPPLGCAVLTLGFSMQKGPLLRIAQIKSERHLPQERFLECLEAFAAAMQCSLERQEPTPSPKSGEQGGSGVRLNTADLKAVLESHLSQQNDKSAKRACEVRNANISAPLSSVLEESEGGDDSDRPRESSPGKLKAQDKPCKRSRVE